MSDHEFEKQVQLKLGEFKLRPTDAVWMEVEKNIRDNKRRRRFLWLWSAALLVALATTGVVLYNYTNHTANIAALDSTKPAAATSSSNPATNNNTVSPNSTNNNAQAATDNASTAAQQQLAIGNEPDNATSATDAAATNGNRESAIVNRESTVAKASADKSAISKTKGQSTLVPRPTDRKGQEEASAIAITSQSTTNNRITKHNNKKPVKKDNSVNGNAHHSNKNKTTPAVTNDNGYNVTANQPGFTVAEPAQQTAHPLTIAIPALATNESDAIATNKAATEPFNNLPLNTLMPDSATSANAVAAMPIQRKKPSLWHWGVKADVGYSRIAVSKLFQLKGLLGTEKAYAEDLSARSLNSPAVSGQGNQFLNVAASVAPVKSPSPIQTDFSTSIGVFIQRTLSPRLKVSVGLEYSYMSVNTRIGKKFDSTIDVNIGTNSLKVVHQFYESPGYVDTVRGTYASIQGQGQGQVYYSQKQRYRFHYIEIPVMLNWQINKGRRMPPLVFEGGVSFGRLFSADALHYEGVKGIYYEDNSLFNKTQFNFVTGLSVGLWQKSKHPVWIGPDLRYSLNGLVKKEVSTGQYMWSTGISFKMLLGRL